MNISKDEIIKIAHISKLDIQEDEIPLLLKQLQDFLNYAVRVQEIAADVEEPSTKNVNAFREDVAVKSDPESILSCAPEREEDFFVVPAILDSNK